MGDCDITPVKECGDRKAVEKCCALSQEVESAQIYSARPLRTGSVREPGYLDFDKADIVAEKKLEAIKEKKCASIDQLDLGAGDFSDQVNCGKKPIDNKLFWKDQDFAQIPTIGPSAAGFFDRVDKNNDGRISNYEMNQALTGDKLNEKEKHVLETIKKNGYSIDTDRDGVSLSDLKEFDAKVTQYNKELAMVRKVSPELADFARVLHQRGKLVDDDHDGKFSYEELTNFYAQCKKEILLNPTAEGKRDLAALNWGMTNFDRYAMMGGSWGRGQITADSLRLQAVREFQREAPGELRQYFLSTRDRYRVERYQSSL